MINTLLLISGLFSASFAASFLCDFEEQSKPKKRAPTTQPHQVDVIPRRRILCGIRPPNIFSTYHNQSTRTQELRKQNLSYANFLNSQNATLTSDMTYVSPINEPYDVENVLVFIDHSGSTNGTVSILEHKALSRMLNQLKTYIDKDIPVNIVPFSLNEVYSITRYFEKTLFTTDHLENWLPFPELCGTQLSSYIRKNLERLSAGSLKNTLCVILTDGEIDDNDIKPTAFELSKIAQYFGLNKKRLDMFVAAFGDLAEHTQTQQRWMTAPKSTSTGYQGLSQAFTISSQSSIIGHTQHSISSMFGNSNSAVLHEEVEFLQTKTVPLALQAPALELETGLLEFLEYPEQIPQTQNISSLDYARLMSEFSSITGSSRCCIVKNEQDLAIFDTVLREIVQKKGRKTLYIKENDMLRIATENELLVMTNILLDNFDYLEEIGYIYQKQQNGLINVNNEIWYLAPNDVVSNIVNPENGKLVLKLTPGIAEDSPYIELINILNGLVEFDVSTIINMEMSTTQ